MTATRTPAAAGRFYPADSTALSRMVRELIAAAAKSESSEDFSRQERRTPPKAIVVPHAGYMFSGPIAASAYARLVPFRDAIERVVLLGPAHFVNFEGLAVSAAEAFETPLGRVPVDLDAIEDLLKLSQVRIADAAHEREHSLEVHLPFLQTVLGDFRLVPIAAGRATPEEAAEAIDRLWDGPETLFVVSSDLSHYHDHATATRLDRETSRAIEGLRAADLRGDRACGYVPLGGLLTAARAHGLQARTIDLRNSGDTAGPRDQVVGYGAYVVE
ncbi:MAG: AmmeMemoRadiSam system protein B [Planctomycetaceae bacterium]